MGVSGRAVGPAVRRPAVSVALPALQASSDLGRHCVVTIAFAFSPAGRGSRPSPCVEGAGRKRMRSATSGHLPLHQVGKPRWVCEALQADQLSLVGEDELLPEPGGPRVRCRRVDRPGSSSRRTAVLRDRHRPVRRRELLHVREVGCSPSRSRWASGPTRPSAASRLHRHGTCRRPSQLREPVDPGRDVAERAAVRERRREDTRDRRAGRSGLVVHATLILVLRLRARRRTTSAASFDEIRVVADRDRRPSSRPSRSRGRPSSNVAPS